MATDPFFNAGSAVRNYIASQMPAPTLRNLIGSGPGGNAILAGGDAAAGFLNGLVGSTPASAPQRGSVVGMVGAPGTSRVAQRLNALDGQAAPAAAKSTDPTDPRAPVGAPTFDQMLRAVAAAQGGKVNLREMSALADITNKTATRTKLPGIADIAGQKALELGDQLANYKIDQAKKSGDSKAYLDAYQEQIDRYERLARARAIDPTAGFQND